MKVFGVILILVGLLYGGRAIAALVEGGQRGAFSIIGLAIGLVAFAFGVILFFRREGADDLFTRARTR